MSPRYPGWLSATFLHFTFWPTGPPGAGNRETQVFQAILAQDGPWHSEKSWARVPKSKKKIPRYPGWLSATFLRFTFCPTGILGHFGLGRPLAKVPGLGRKQKKCNFPGLGALLGGKSGRPKSFPPKVRNFFTFYVLADRTPTGGKLRTTWFLGHFGLGRPLALREILGRTKKNTNSLIEAEKRETNPLQLGPNTQS